MWSGDIDEYSDEYLDLEFRIAGLDGSCHVNGLYLYLLVGLLA